MEGLRFYPPGGSTLRKQRFYPSYRILVKGGKWVEVSLVVILYRCEECHAKLKRHNAGVVCSENPGHKHVIHRDEVARIEAQQEADLEQAKESYAINDDRIIYTGDFEI